MSKSVIAKHSRAYRLWGTYAVLSFLYTLQAVLAAGSGEVQVPASPGSGRRRGTMVKRAVVVGSLAVGLAGITVAGEARAQVPPLSPLVPGPTNVPDFVSGEEAAKVLGKALFWDMQAGSLVKLGRWTTARGWEGLGELIAVQGIGKQTVKINREHMTVGAPTPLKHARPRP
jgi:hypothetical protein